MVWGQSPEKYVKEAPGKHQYLEIITGGMWAFGGGAVVT
jgi:hypothetical protein